MSEPFLAEVRIVGFNFAPRGWAQCDGQILPINQNQSLYSLLGTTYGGDGRTSFGLPDLRGRAPMHEGEGHSQGQKSGEETHILSINEIPSHDHVLRATNEEAEEAEAENTRILARAIEAMNAANSNADLVNMASNSIANAGGSQGHNNMQPYLAVNFIIALQGLFPSRN